MERHINHEDDKDSGDKPAIKVVGRNGRWRKFTIIATVSILVAVVVGGIVFTLSQQQQKSADVQIKADVVTHSTDTPSEEKPGADFQWKGTKDDPRKLTIKSIGVDAYIQNVGVDQKQAMAVPNNIHIAGWFVESMSPGEKGLSIIDGHLDGLHSDGVFDKLGEVSIGDTVDVEFGDGRNLSFKVKSVSTVGLDKAAEVLYTQDPSISSQLSLITCGGAYDKEAKMYDKRIIVITELIKESANS